MEKGRCPKREESSAMNDKTKSLVLVNHFRTIPTKRLSCIDNSKSLLSMLSTCYLESGQRWANFVAVDFYKVGSPDPFGPPHIFLCIINNSDFI